MRQPDQSEIDLSLNEERYLGYYKIARHYKWALNTTFAAGFQYLIIVEGKNENPAMSVTEISFENFIALLDDLTISPDFYEYFLGTHDLLKNDPTLWCVSAWNDNGKTTNIDITKPEMLYRSDFFPGLGWMLTRDLWHELAPKWPKG